MENNIKSQITDHTKLLTKLDLDSIRNIAQMAADCFLNGGKLYICGSALSGFIAQYAAAMLMNKCTLSRPPLPAIALRSDLSYIPLHDNATPCDTDIFEKQISALATGADIVWGFAADKSCETVVRALRIAAQNKIKTVGFVGIESDGIQGLCDVTISVAHESPIRVQEIHFAAVHLICDTIDTIIFSQS
ncbi:MAG: SIS domain-containing protein [Deferribacteraceae bacterium]|jgi:D-sedoheptulose 7-phosphate isomerase|nr:SIS domain-containing protein [Deferribacteraceae bacterium]